MPASTTFPVSQVPTEFIKIVTAKNDEVKREPGLILSREDIINIKLYVKYGLALPTDSQEVVTYLGYSRSGVPGLEPEDIRPLFAGIRGNAQTWNDIESNVQQQSIDLDNFASKMTSMGGKILEYINKMDIYVQAVNTVGDTSLQDSGIEIPFQAEDRKVISSLGKLVEVLLKSIEVEEQKTRQLKEKIALFKTKISDELEPTVKRKWELITRANISAEVSQINSQIEILQGEIDQLKKDYDKYVGLAFTGAAGGIVGLAITGGIFGEKAEKARKSKNKKIKEKAELECRLANRQAIALSISSLNNHFEDLHIRLIDAEEGAGHLAFVWQSLYTNISNSLSSLKTIENGMDLLTFVIAFGEVINPWKEVKNSTAQLMKIFDEAIAEYKRLYHS
ncbi:alpha-xenorhabdolysin family binary toxin subunit A [Nodosilinea sp. FACHB-131]|uniref:alpha-xenorhabdolysin family binary toxin subunit A n=1 Tax=Cyanophyceae TaxID=3028117 RepID=UPI0016839F4B|nr:alpha-xenorhabdolysin family binary toxin subunit A [Nodosilinea sp. FACHB-131]MBD1876962.1 alpha-xenorhabdolysin family binary toxin subunit A [Nodosilinea sp. FACHB-131]